MSDRFDEMAKAFGSRCHDGPCYSDCDDVTDIANTLRRVHDAAVEECALRVDDFRMAYWDVAEEIAQAVRERKVTK